MSIEELKAKWQAHDPATRMTIDANLLFKEVLRNHRALRSQLWWRDINEMLAAIVITFVFSVLAVLIGEWTLILSAAGSLFVGLFFHR